MNKEKEGEGERTERGVEIFPSPYMSSLLEADNLPLYHVRDYYFSLLNNIIFSHENIYLSLV